ncbi:hypothetical protein BH11ACT2_BH11ACT2_00920 [soil metagenome]
MRSVRIAAAVGVLVIGSALFAGVGPASAVQSTFPNPDKTALTTDLDINALQAEYSAEAITVSVGVENFDPAAGYNFNVTLTSTQRTISEDPNYLTFNATVSGNSQIITASRTDNGVTTGPFTFPGTITVSNNNFVTFTLPLDGALSNTTFFVWASLGNVGHSVNAGIPVVGGIVGFGPLNPSVVDTTTFAVLSSPTQVHNSTPAVIRAGVNPIHGPGTIAIKDGSTVIASGDFAGTDVSINLPKSLAYGTHHLVAVYIPRDPTFYASSTSDPVTIKVLSPGTKTSTSLFISKSKQHYKGSAAKVKVHVSHKPAGKVAIYDGKKKLKTLTLKRGSATYTLSKKLSKGTHKLHAVFTPKHIDSYAPSTSKSKTLKVVK